MSRSRRLTVGTAAVVAAVALIPSGASAAPDGSWQGLVLTGQCPDGKDLPAELIVVPRTPFLVAPLRLMDVKLTPSGEYTPTGKWLFPYTVLITGDPELKTRHLTPDVPYTRPGKPPKNPVTCVFTGVTQEKVDFTVQISGQILSVPRSGG